MLSGYFYSKELPHRPLKCHQMNTWKNFLPFGWWEEFQSQLRREDEIPMGNFRCGSLSLEGFAPSWLILMSQTLFSVKISSLFLFIAHKQFFFNPAKRIIKTQSKSTYFDKNMYNLKRKQKVFMRDRSTSWLRWQNQFNKFDFLFSDEVWQFEIVLPLNIK